ncbi:MAG: hypothetical protein U0271_10145 [Polyangiaceae bacterium]
MKLALIGCLLLVGCGGGEGGGGNGGTDSGGSGGSGGATDGPTVLVDTCDGNTSEPVTGIDWVANDATGKLVDHVVTADSPVTIAAPPGGTISMLRRDTTSDGAAYHSVRSYRVVEGLTALHGIAQYDPPPANSPMSVVHLDVTVPPDLVGVVMMLSCGASTSVANSTGIIDVAGFAGCAGRSTFMALALGFDPNGKIVSYDYVGDVPFVPGGEATVSFDMDRTTFGEIAYDLTNIPSSAVVGGVFANLFATEQLAAYSDDFENFGGLVGASYSGVFRVPTELPGRLTAYVTVTEPSDAAGRCRTSSLEQFDLDPAETLSWDVAGKLGPMTLTGPDDAPTWSVEGAAGSWMLLNISANTPSWSGYFSLLDDPARGSGSWVFPELPDELVDFNPPSDAAFVAEAFHENVEDRSYVSVVEDGRPPSVSFVESSVERCSGE